MKHKRLLIHMLSIGVLAAGLELSILIQPEPGGYVRLAQGIAMVALVLILASFLMNGKLVPLITSIGYFISFLFAFFFQRDGIAPAAEPQIILADFGSSSIPPFSCSPSILNLYMSTKNSICNSKPGRLL